MEEFDKAETVRNLFYLAELDLDSLESFQDSPSNLIKILNAASNKLTKRLNPTWKGDPIHVDLRYSPGNIMSLVISDVHRDGTITNTGLLNRRAEGFKWTFSFIVELCRRDAAGRAEGGHTAAGRAGAQPASHAADGHCRFAQGSGGIQPSAVCHPTRRS